IDRQDLLSRFSHTSAHNTAPSPCATRAAREDHGNQENTDVVAAAFESAGATSTRGGKWVPSDAETCANSSTIKARPRSPRAILAARKPPYEPPLPQRIDALICPRWTVRAEPPIAVEENLVAAVDHGRIVALLPRAEAEA